jgi:hypothetical protein
LVLDDRIALADTRGGTKCPSKTYYLKRGDKRGIWPAIVSDEEFDEGVAILKTRTGLCATPTLCDPKSYLSPDSRGITLPHAPEWVTSFRILSEDVQHLNLPARQELSPEERIKNDEAAPPPQGE